MTVNAVPKRLDSTDIAEGHVCPIGGVTSSHDKMTRWVACPMVSGDLITYGACLDLQDLARSEEFYSDPFLDLFEGVAKRIGSPLQEVRRICLRHQSDLLSDMISSADEDSEGVRRTLFRVYSRLAEEYEESECK